MNTKEKELAHECAEKGAYWQRTFSKQRNQGIIFAVVSVLLGIFTMPLGILLLIGGGMSLGIALVSHLLSDHAYKECFEIRDEIIKQGEEHETEIH